MATLNRAYSDEPCTAPQPEIISILGRLRATHEQANMCRSTVNCFADRMLGERVTDGSAPNAPRPVRSGALGEIHDLLDEIGATLAYANEGANRLEQIG